MTLAEFPDGVAAELVSMSTIGLIESFNGCAPELNVDPNKIVFWLWNTEDHGTAKRLDRNNPIDINPENKIIFIIHGWLCNITNSKYGELKDAYLKRYPYANIISIEWTTYSIDLYTNAFCYIPNIGKLIGKFLCNLNSKYTVDIRQIHIVGHSMGAQIAGLVGQETKSRCNKELGRVTGLDPAGPLYQTISRNRRLDASDATTVDVIHTNQGIFGYYGSCGTVDFYPNCGYQQPGCTFLKNTKNINVLLNQAYTTITCNHFRSVEYFTESILSEAFVAKSCLGCPGIPFIGPCVADASNQSSAVMGEYFEKYLSRATEYYLVTNKKYPYARSAFSKITPSNGYSNYLV